MININNNMWKLIKKFNIEQIDLKFNNVAVLNNITRLQFKKINDCILIDLNENLEKNIEQILCFKKSKSEFEYSNNEVLVNSFLEDEDPIFIFKTSLQIISFWTQKLKKEFPNFNFCIAMNYDNGYSTLWVYTERENEDTILSENLDNYKEESIMVYKF